MKNPTIRFEGAIIAADIIEKIEQGEIIGQKPADFKIEGSFKVKDEIARAWADARDYWRIFQRKRESLAGDARQMGTSETRNQWMIPFLSILGYKAEFAKGEEINGKSYAISHRDRSRDMLPIHIMSFKDDLDKKRQDSGPRMSPHALVQEYLNLTEHLYALVTNGLQLRLLRDSSRLIKQSFIEFDIERMMDEEQYTDFAVLFRLLHVTRMPVNQETAAESFLEMYHQNSLESGSRIRDGLSEAVRKSILAFANGFLQHPKNEELRRWFEEGDHKEKEKEFFQWQLRLIYRLLFLMVIEERDLIYPKNADKQKKKYYYDYYSINKLRRLSEKRHLADPRYNDFWQSIRNTFRIFENEKYGKPLGIAPLSGLFEIQQIGILNNATLDNKVVMECLRKLSVFKNKDNNQVMRVNYASLNVEEFGSVYEGLLAFDGLVKYKDSKFIFSLEPGSGRSSSGSHYTPDELVQPLIKHSLDYIIADKLKQKNPEEALLSITVCDVACGSGHILLNAARRIATELAILRSHEDQPSPTFLRQAIREVIRHCIYGVDLNPLAVELCKVALWLEAHNPNEPLNFLDHRIKCGDAIVGLAHFEELEKGIASEAFKSLPGDDKDIAAAYRKRNEQERKAKGQLSTYAISQVDEQLQGIRKEYAAVVNIPESNPEEIDAKRLAYQKLVSGSRWMRIKQLADMQVAQFFIPKTSENKDRLVTESIYKSYLNSNTQIMGQGPAMATATAVKKRFFHYFLEFPEVFAEGGFDCVIGNPPFLGRRKLTGAFGDNYLEYLKHEYKPIGAEDLVTYFFRRIFEIISPNGFLSLISTNTISQGGAREFGLDVIVLNGGKINHAVSSMKWPGLAAVEISLISIYKGNWSKGCYLNNRISTSISTYLDDSSSALHPYVLCSNLNLSFKGSEPAGMGFILTPNEAHSLVNKNIRNREVIFPYLNGDDLNNNPDCSASRWAINFFDWHEEKARQYQDCYEIIEHLVKPERQRWKKDNDGKDIIGDYALRRPLPEKWWIYGEKRPALYQTIASLDRVLVIARTSNTDAFVFVNKNQVLNANLTIIATEKYIDFSLLQATIHFTWAYKYSTKLESRLIYQPTDIYETYPFPDIISQTLMDKLEVLGYKYHDHRRDLLIQIKYGLTKTYNLFHSKELRHTVQVEDAMEDKAFEKLVGKEAMQLRKHLARFPEAISLNEVTEGIFRLRELHVQMDEAVLEAYGWQENSQKWGPAIQLRHDFYEVDYLPENNRIRYTIHPEARKEVLKRLLKLNHEIHEEEVKQGLWDKSGSKGKVQSSKLKEQRAKGEGQSDDEALAAEPKIVYTKQTNLFEEPPTQITQSKKVGPGSKVTIRRIRDGQEYHYHITPEAHQDSFTGNYKQISTTSGLALAMRGKSVGGKFEFGDVWWEVVEVG